MPVTVVETDGLFCRYGAVEVISDLSFTLVKGDYVSLVGPNGSGKSTLVRAVLGLVHPVAGSISLFGTPLAGFRDWHRIGYLPQRNNSLNPYFPASVREIVGSGLTARSSQRDWTAARRAMAVDRALDLLDIRALQNELIGELSGGQQQRALLARAIVGEPDLLILDEPSAALDPETRERFFALLDSQQRQKGIAIILVTHDIGSVGRYATKLLYLDKRLIFFGSFDDFCASDDMGTYFGPFSQHLICHRHDRHDHEMPVSARIRTK